MWERRFFKCFLGSTESNSVEVLISVSQRRQSPAEVTQLVNTRVRVRVRG